MLQTVVLWFGVEFTALTEAQGKCSIHSDTRWTLLCLMREQQED